MALLKTNTDSMLMTKIMPQVIHGNMASKREYINKAVNVTFNAAEIISIAIIFITLYYYRLSEEYGFSLWQEFGVSTQLPRFQEYIIFFSISILLWITWSYSFKLFSLKTDISISLIEEIIRCFKAVSYSVLITIGIAFVFKLTDYSRLVILTFWGASIISSVGLRSFKRLLMISLAKKGLLVKNVVIIGAGKVGELISQELQDNKSLGYKIIGFIDDERKKSINSIKVLGNVKEIEKIIKNYSVDEIIITIPAERDIINDLLKRFRKYGITIRVVPELFNLVSKTVEVGTFNSIPFITLIKTPMRGIPFLIKRGLDFILSFIGLVLLFPLLTITAVLIKLDSSGPIVYKQRRVGKNGKMFHMYKFRSMVVNADEIKRKYIDLNEMDGPVFKIKNDPRITKIGKFIRKYSIDELPQLFNVLKGDMSLIGPRPPLPREVEAYSDWQWRRLEITPGATGLWQVSGRSELSFDQWVNLDLYYIENWSLWLDLKILLKTLPVIIKGEGSY